MLKIKNLTKNFNNIVALDNVSIEIQKNSIIGLAGPSGCGKSTLLRCVQKLEKFNSGSIELNGNTGYMFQDFQLFPNMTVLKNITFALDIKNKQIEKNKKKAIELLKNLSLDKYIDTYPSKLSGGQKQRVAFARTLILHPDLILCDEPTSGLDISTTQKMVAILQTVKDMGMTMLIASHDINFLKQITDLIYILKNGKVISRLSPKNIRSNEEYLQFFD